MAKIGTSLDLGVFYGSSAPGQMIVTNGLVIGSWTHTALTLSKSATSVQWELFRNGNLIGSANFGTAVWPPNATMTNNFIGRGEYPTGGNGEGPFVGRFDSFRIHTRKLSQVQIQGMMSWVVSFALQLVQSILKCFACKPILIRAIL